MKQNLISPLYGTSAIIREHYKGYNGKTDGPKTLKKKKSKKVRQVKLNDPKTITSRYHRNELYLQNQDINLWCRQLGMSRHELESHPHIADVGFLLEFKREFQNEYNTSNSLKGTFAAYWGNTYKLKKPLTSRSFIKLEKLALECIKIRQQNQNKINKIKSLRGSAKKQNIGHDNKAKGPCLPQGTNTKGEQQECRVVPQRVWTADELWW